MNKSYLEDCLLYSQTHTVLTINHHIEKFFLGLNYAYIKKTLTPDELDFFILHYQAIKRLESRNNLNAVNTCRYVRYFCRHPMPWEEVILHRKFQLSATACRKNILPQLGNDLDSFNITVRRIPFKVTRIAPLTYQVKRHKGISGYVVLHQLVFRKKSVAPGIASPQMLNP